MDGVETEITQLRYRMKEHNQLTEKGNIGRTIKTIRTKNSQKEKKNNIKKRKQQIDQIYT